MLQRMFGDTARSADPFRQSAIGIGQSHVRSGLQIVSVAHALRQVAGYESNTFQSKQITKSRSVAVDIRFHAMKERVESLPCGKHRRNRQHKFWVDEGEGRETIPGPPSYFLLTFGYDEPRIGFGSRAGGRSNGNDRERFVFAFAASS